ncbi:MAG: Chorismate mutase type [Planctomycetota bacterium]
MPDDPELQALRAAVDDCNRRLFALLQERAALAGAIGVHKRRHGLPAIDPQREQAMASALAAAPPAGPLDARALQRILDAVLLETRRLVAEPPNPS